MRSTVQQQYSIRNDLARQLHAQAPRLRKVTSLIYGNDFANHVRHTILQLALQVRTCTQAEAAEPEVMVSECKMYAKCDR